MPLGQLARIEEVSAPAAIRREAGMRRIAVEAAVEGRDLGGTADAVRERLRALALPSGYFLDVGGRVESQERAARALAVAIAVALFAVFVLLYARARLVRPRVPHPRDAPRPRSSAASSRCS